MGAGQSGLPGGAFLEFAVGEEVKDARRPAVEP
jgi:hypothetical protein